MEKYDKLHDKLHPKKTEEKLQGTVSCLTPSPDMVEKVRAHLHRTTSAGKHNLITLFSPLFLRLCTQRLKKIAHPGYSYILLVPLYFASAIMFRVMQAELENLKVTLAKCPVNRE